MKELELLKEQLKNKWNKKLNKKKVKYVRRWNKRFIRKVRCRFDNSKTKMHIFWKTLWIKFHWKRKKIKNISKKWRINEIKWLKEKTENDKDELLDHLLEGENKFSKLLTDLEYEKHDALNDIAVLESNLIKLEISPLS